MFRWLIAAWLCFAGVEILTSTAHAADGLKIVVILDNSGSMNERMPRGGTRIEAAKKSLLTVLDQVPNDAEVGVLLLNPTNQGHWLIPLGPLDQPSTQAAIVSITANGMTPLGGALKMAADALLELRETQRYGTYKVLVVSDGEATDGNLVNRYLPEVQSRGILIDVIGVAMPGQLSLAQSANTYRRADDPQSLEKAISAVVLGESDNDSGGDAGESDFELLQALPVEVATASLAALATRQNLPIGEAGRVEPRQHNQPPGNFGGPNQPPAPQVDAEGGTSSFRIIVFGMVFLFVAMKVMSSIGKRR